jgi:hypothetical protein
MKSSETVFIHFIGNCRFDHGLYASLGRNEIRKLGSAPAGISIA